MTKPNRCSHLSIVRSAAAERRHSVGGAWAERQQGVGGASASVSSTDLFSTCPERGSCPKVRSIGTRRRGGVRDSGSGAGSRRSVRAAANASEGCALQIPLFHSFERRAQRLASDMKLGSGRRLGSAVAPPSDVAEREQCRSVSRLHVHPFRAKLGKLRLQSVGRASLAS